MQAYEFNSIVENEGVIHIPKQYLVKISSPRENYKEKIYE
jgi:hypothetical protein